MIARTVRFFERTLFAAVFVFLGTVRASKATDDDETFFETRIRPVLASSCIECHGPKKASGGLRLDSQEGVNKGGDSGLAIEPGNPHTSLLVRAVRRDADAEIKMPPEKPLSEQAVEDLTRWIEAGAKWPASLTAPIPSDRRHWAFEPLKPVELPEDPTLWATQPIDRLIAVAQRENGLKPVPPASKLSLLRRAYFDLIGLPPTPEQIDAFLKDNSPNAFADVVDELLSSPRYGERWARHWLDLVRYADTAGDNSDYPIPQAYLYRDYVIDAFNADVPYDRFLHEQLAGDLIAKDAPESEYARLVIATGFIAQSKRIGTRELEDMHLIIEDTLSTLGPAIMGLSIRCARCHDHKFDPLTMEDYYGMYGFFASTQYPFAGAEEVRKQTKFASLISPKQMREKQASQDKEDPLAGIPTAYAVGELKPVDVPIQTNGNPHTSSGVTARRGIPKILDADPLAIPSGASGRLELAHWLTNKGNFLTARVMANRIWQNHFGKSIVPTPSDYGFRGSPPTHPELLDWLANALIESGWSIKSLHRSIMLSNTYQLSTDGDAKNFQVDSGNIHYWRFDRRRLDAESLRDTLLMLGGSLNLSRPGPHPFPEPSKWRYTAHHQFNDVCYPSDHRSVYLMVQRLHAHPYLSLFNGADPSLSTPIRDSSTVSMQALYLLNSAFVHQKANGFANSLLNALNVSQDRIESAYLHVFGRRPTDDEVAKCTAFIDRYVQSLEAEGVPIDRREVEAWSSLVRALFAANEFFYVD
ncbi:MAG: PSD1 and planctomycete cytochrome C domain-containing protein [Pirellula sp.]|nr:PSD1 and planctomycete cytochrome C domain-containing protein [Pirellula sp.]